MRIPPLGPRWEGWTFTQVVLMFAIVRLTQVLCVTSLQPPLPPFTLVNASTTARVAERQTRRT